MKDQTAARTAKGCTSNAPATIGQCPRRSVGLAAEHIDPATIAERRGSNVPETDRAVPAAKKATGHAHTTTSCLEPADKQIPTLLDLEYGSVSWPTALHQARRPHLANKLRSSMTCIYRRHPIWIG